MPTYDYECTKCKYRFELFQSMKDEPRKRCPKCRGKVQRLIGTGAGLIFKGSGFYQTDYRSESYKKGAEADKPKKKEKDSTSSSSKSDAASSSSKSTGKTKKE